MPRSDGHINYALVDKSRRLQKIIALLKRADYPLSGMEIQIQAWVTNASTGIAEIRSEGNMRAGYAISGAQKWRGNKYIWHDGNPRYFLIAAPGWTPRWTVTKEGEILPYTASRGVCDTDIGVVPNIKTTALPTSPENSPVLVSARLCRLQSCRAPIPGDRPENAAFCGDDHKDEYWKLVREVGKAALG